MSTDLLSPSPTTGAFGGVVQEYIWSRENKQYRVVYESLGTGSPLLLLPAFSTVSSRTEVAPLAKLLSPHFQTVGLDWLGFGDSDRPSLNYNPAIYQQLLTDFVTSVFNQPITVVAAGHSSPYVLQLAASNPSAFSRIILVAPTWLGPLAAMGMKQPIRDSVKELVRSPLIGLVLYKMNTAPSFLKFMYRRHVYVDRGKLTPEFIDKKWQITQRPGARFAPAAFVTGNLDAVRSRSEFLELVQRVSVPIKVIIAENAPPKSRAEMDALAALPGITSALLPGTLGMHEEYADAVAGAILD